MNTRSLRLPLAVMMLLAGGGQRVSGQVAECGDFGNDSCPPDFHYVHGGGQNNKNPHAHCWGPCAPGVECHGVCTGSLVSNPRVYFNYQAILAAADAGDLERVLRLGTKSEYVTFNHARQAIQIVSCSGTSIVASLPVRSSAMLTLAMRLPRTNMVLASLLSAPVPTVAGDAARGGGT